MVSYTSVLCHDRIEEYDLKILCIGDVVGTVGCEFLRKKLSSFKKLKGINLTICNGENASDGNGILPQTADYLFSVGCDVITLGNHTFTRKEIASYLDDNEYIIRPANYSRGTPGCGYCTVDMGFTQVAVINIMGQEFIGVSPDNPYYAVDDILNKTDSKIVLVDFHAETTGEKRAMGFYLDGRVSAVFGTHTHCQTADEEILPCGTGYITDLGMTGPIDSVLGVRKEIIIERLKNKMPMKFLYAEGPCKMDCVIFDIDVNTGKTISVERMEIRD